MAPIGTEKDSFCFLDVTVFWEDFELALELGKMCQKEIKNNKGFLSYLTRMTAGNTLLVKNIARHKNISEANAWW